MRLSGVFDTIFTISKRKIANYVHRRVREASKTGFGTSVWVTVGACDGSPAGVEIVNQYYLKKD